MWNILYVPFVCWLVNVCVFNICAQHSDGLVKLQGTDFSFCLCRLFLKTIPCLTVWSPRISWRFLLSLNAIIGLIWNTPWNSVFICKIFQFLFTIFDIIQIVLLCFIDSEILFLLLFSLFVNSNFLSVLSSFLICSSRNSFQQQTQTCFDNVCAVSALKKIRPNNISSTFFQPPPWRGSLIQVYSNTSKR